MPGHAAADLEQIDLARALFVHEAAAEDHDDTVGKRQKLVEAFAHEQYGRATIAHRHDLRVNLRNRREIEPKAGIGRNHDIHCAAELARQHGTLHVAAGEIAYR